MTMFSVQGIQTTTQVFKKYLVYPIFMLLQILKKKKILKNLNIHMYNVAYTRHNVAILVAYRNRYVRFTFYFLNYIICIK